MHQNPAESRNLFGHFFQLKTTIYQFRMDAERKMSELFLKICLMKEAFICAHVVDESRDVGLHI
jgi:hypothetical protein